MLRYIAVVAIVLMTIGGNAQASLLTPGNSVGPDLFTAANDTTLLASASGAWTTPGVGGIGAGTGTFTDAVYSTTAPGTLDFVYQFSNAAASHNSITETTALSFAGFTPLNVGFMPDGGSLPGGIFVNGSVAPGIPAIISEDGLGSTVSFNFDVLASQNITPGITSSVLVIRANATNFSPGLVGLIAGGTTNLPGFQPLTAVPEPSFFLPLGAGLLAVVALGRRKFTQRTRE